MKPLVLALALAAALLPGCSSLAEHVARARTVNDEVIATAAWPADSVWVVVADGKGAGAVSEEKALEIRPDAPHRYVFLPEDAGDRRARMPFLPSEALVGGREFAEALGLSMRRDARGGVVLSRGGRRLRAEPGGKLLVRIENPDASVESAAAILLDPDFYGPLMVSPAIAEQLVLRRFEVPGEARMDVALGRPFPARRARVRVTIEDLDAAGSVEALYRQ